MQVLLLVLSIALLTIIAGNGRAVTEARNNKVVMKRYKPMEKNASLAIPGDRLSVYSSRFDLIVN